MLKLPSLGELDRGVGVRIYLCTYKRLEVGTFRMPAACPDATSVELKASELAMLLEGIDLGSIRRRKRFQRLA